MQTDATSHNIVACCWGFLANGYVRLHGPKSLTGFKLYATSANKCQQVPTSANIVVIPCKRTQQVTTLLPVVEGFWPTVASVCIMGLTVWTVSNYLKQVPTLLWFHANGCNKSQHCCLLLGVFSQQCCVRLHGPKSLTGLIRNKCQQVPTLLCFHANGRNMLGPPMLPVVGQQCCVRLHGPQVNKWKVAIQLSPVQTNTTCWRNITQHCWDSVGWCWL